MQIFLNGQPLHLDEPISVSQLLEHHGFAQRRVAVEVNLRIVPKSQHDQHLLQADDKVEIVHALGGG